MTELEELERMHHEIEAVFYHALDHMHADMLHEYIDRQQIKIDKLRAENDHLKSKVGRLERENSDMSWTLNPDGMGR